MQSTKLLKPGIIALLLVAITVFSGCDGGGIVPSINHSPAITSIPNTTAFVEVAYTYDVNDTDPDVGDILTYSLTGSSPEGMTIDPTTGVINWVPTATQIGNNNVTVEVSDNGSPVESDTQSFTIIVSSAGRISGIVISDAGGPAVEGSTVTVDDSTINTTTDAEGNYVIDKVPVGTHDIIVTQSGRATSKVQNVVVIKDQTTTVDFIQKKVNVPTWETEPPTISTTGIAEGATLSGIVTCSVQVADALDIKYVFVDLYIPCELENEYYNIILPSFNTTVFPDGDYQVTVVAYDMNYNRSQLTLNITIDNSVTGGNPPATPTSLWPLSVTLGENVGFFSTGRSELFNKIGTKEDPNIINLPEDKTIDLDSIIKVAGPDSTLFVEIIWDSVVDATGYKIYRKFEGEATYYCIGSTEYPEFIDTDPRLSIGKKTYYQISAFNAFGESDPTTAEWTTPLPKFNLNLVSPADGATGVSLTPTLQWAPVVAVGNYREYEFYVMGKNDNSSTWEDATVNETFVVYDGTPLQYLKVYEWNVDYAIAFDYTYNYYDSIDLRAISIAGGGTGSLNGAFVFTTQSE